MQYQSQFGVHRPAGKDGLFGNRRVSVPWKLELVQNVANREVFECAVDDDTERPIGVMLAYECHRPGEIGILHFRHGNQKMIGEARKRSSRHDQLIRMRGAPNSSALFVNRHVRVMCKALVFRLMAAGKGAKGEASRAN